MPRKSPVASPKATAKAGASQRQLRVAEEIRHILAEVLARGEVHDPVLAAHTVTIPEVRITPDLKLATAFVMPLLGKDTEKVVAALEKHTKFLRGEVGHRMNLRYVPELRFREDVTFAEADRIDRLLHTPEVAQDLGPREFGPKPPDKPGSDPVA